MNENISINKKTQQQYYARCVKKYRTRINYLMKVYLNSPKENWIVDRFVKEWKKYNKQNSTNFIKTSDIVWIISPWTYEKLSKKY